MRSGNLVSGPGLAFIINGGHSLIGGPDYLCCLSWMGGPMCFFSSWWWGSGWLCGDSIAHRFCGSLKRQLRKPAEGENQMRKVEASCSVAPHFPLSFGFHMGIPQERVPESSIAVAGKDSCML